MKTLCESVSQVGNLHAANYDSDDHRKLITNVVRRERGDHARNSENCSCLMQPTNCVKTDR